MDTTVINVKVQPELKVQLQGVAQELGLTVSALTHGFYKNLVRTRTVTFGLSEEPSEYLKQALKEAKADIKAGRVSPSFDNAAEAIKWLRNSEKKHGRKV